MPEAATVIADLARPCRAAGIDLVQPLNAAWYDAEVPADYRLPDVGRARPLALVLASTRAFWPPFVARLRAEPWRLDGRDPVDRYVVDTVRDALARIAVRSEVRFSHEGPPRRVAMQRLAHTAGLAYLAPGMLCVHPVFGPWIALRAAVVLDLDGPSGPRPTPRDPCGGCDERCVPALAHASALATASDAAVGELWREWLAVRDACRLGREHRYPEALIRYVYTKDKAVLRDAVHERSTGG